MNTLVHAIASKKKNRFGFAITACCITLILSACTNKPERDIFLKADPAVNSQLDRKPRTLRIFLAGKPDIEKSSLTLDGPRGKEELTRFHTMGADDLMIEIKSRPIPDGKYTVTWEAIIEGDENTYSGKYSFSLYTK
ncbi:MAG: copper resistance protein CopC [Cellvibrionaceae bacterium]